MAKSQEVADPRIERSFLTTMLMADATLPFETFLDLREDAFIDRRHQLIWRVIRETHAAQLPINYTTISIGVASLPDDPENPSDEYLLSVAIGDRTILPDMAYEFADMLRNARSKRLLGTTLRTIYQQTLTDRPVNEIAQAAIAQIMDIARGSEQYGWRSLAEVLDDAQEELNAREAGHSDLIPTGYHEIDHILRGLKRGSVNVVAGRPGSGKSALMGGMALNNAEWYQLNDRPGCVGYITMEMAATDIAQRLVTGRYIDPAHPGKVILDGRILRAGFRLDYPLDEQNRKIDEAAKRLWRDGKRSQQLHAGKRLFFFDHMLTSEGIVSRALQLQREHGLEVLYIDYLDLIADPRRSSNADRLMDISRALLKLAKDYGFAIVIGVQLSRDSLKAGDRRPDLEHMGGTDAIGRDAWTVIAVHRPTMYFPVNQEDENNPVHRDVLRHYQMYSEAIVLKNRNGGLGNVPLLFHPEGTAFETWPAVWDGTLASASATQGPGALIEMIQAKERGTKAVA